MTASKSICHFHFYTYILQTNAHISVKNGIRQKQAKHVNFYLSSCSEFCKKYYVLTPFLTIEAFNYNNELAYMIWLLEHLIDSLVSVNKK